MTQPRGEAPLDEQGPIYIDYSIFSTFQTCEEKCRLSYVRHLRPHEEAPALGFGSAFHAGIEQWLRTRDIQEARAGFLAEVRRRGTLLPLSMESDEKRSIERGIYLLDAYVEKWGNEPYEILRRPDNGQPYVEVGFAIHIMDWRDRPVYLVGKLDSLKKSLMDGRIRIFESKTTSRGLQWYLDQVRPNHQITGYYLGASALGIEPAGCVWDCVFVSDRKPDARKGGWMNYGIDIEKDFGRRETKRSEVDLEEYLADLRHVTSRYLLMQESNLKRWPRNAPTACFMFGGCQFIEVCSTNANENVIRTHFKVEVWAPWEGLLDRQTIKPVLT